MLGCIFSTPTLEHALAAMENLQDLHSPDVFQNKESTKIAQRTRTVSLKSQLDAAEIFLAAV